MTAYVIEQRSDFFLTYQMFVQVRYLAKKIEGLTHIDNDTNDRIIMGRKIESIINDVLSKRLRRESKLKGFEYWIDQEAIQKAEYHERTQKEFRRMEEENFINVEAKKRIFEREKEKVREEREKINEETKLLNSIGKKKLEKGL